MVHSAPDILMQSVFFALLLANIVIYLLCNSVVAIWNRLAGREVLNRRLIGSLGVLLFLVVVLGLLSIYAVDSQFLASLTFYQRGEYVGRIIASGIFPSIIVLGLVSARAAFSRKPKSAHDLPAANLYVRFKSVFIFLGVITLIIFSVNIYRVVYENTVDNKEYYGLVIEQQVDDVVFQSQLLVRGQSLANGQSGLDKLQSQYLSACGACTLVKKEIFTSLTTEQQAMLNGERLAFNYIKIDTQNKNDFDIRISYPELAENFDKAVCQESAKEVQLRMKNGNAVCVSSIAE